MMLRKEWGFTLIEAVLSIALTGLVLAGLFGLFSGSLHSWQQGRSALAVQQTVRSAVDFMARDITYAKTMVVSGGGTKITFTTDKYGVVDQAIEYSVNVNEVPRKVYRKLPGGTPQPVTGDSSTKVSIVNPANSYASPFGGTLAVFTILSSNTVEINLAGVDYEAYLLQPTATPVRWNAYRINTAVRAMNMP